jgi:hypothetical protein
MHPRLAVFALSVLLGATHAGAQSVQAPLPPPPAWPPWPPAPVLTLPPPGMVPVRFEADGLHHRFTLSEEGSQQQFARCRGACTVLLWPDQEYRLTVGATRETVQGSRVFRVHRPARVQVTPREDSGWGSSGLATAGFITLGGGTLLFGLAVAAAADDEARGDAAALGVIGMVAMATGLVLTIIGAALPPKSEPRLKIK